MIDPGVVAEAKRALGRQLAARRNGADLNQHQLAQLVQYGRSVVANAETGYSLGSRAFWERCDEALHAAGAILRSYDQVKALIRQQRAEAAGLIEQRQAAVLADLPNLDSPAPGGRFSTTWTMLTSADTVDDVNRRTALSIPALALLGMATAPAEPWNRLAYVLDHPEQLDETTLENLEAHTGDLFRREEQAPARQIASDLDAHVERLRRLVARSPEVFTRRLLTTVGETLALAGWVAWDRKQNSVAAHLYGEALRVARHAGDGPLAACVLAYQSYAAEATGDLASARQLLVAAQSYVRAEGSATTRAWLSGREAEVNAALADQTSALRALDRAMVAYDYAHPSRERSWTGFFTPSRLGSMTVTTYARLDHPELDATTDSVVASLPSTDAKIKAVILADVATAAIQRGRHDRGAQLAYEALDQTLTREASLGRQRLHDLHLMIQDKRDDADLAALDDRIVAQVV